MERPWSFCNSIMTSGQEPITLPNNALHPPAAGPDAERPRVSADALAGSFRSITDSRTGGPMPDVNDALAANRAAVLDLVAAAERSAATWTTPRAPGKWSPSQVVEHVARGLEEGANVVSGAPKIGMPPAFLRPLVRLYFNRILKKGAFPKGWKANKAFDPAT